MKKLLMKFSDNVLSKGQMKGVKGGNGYGEGSCTIYCRDAGGADLGEVTANDCNDTICECQRKYSNAAQSGCSCA